MPMVYDPKKKREGITTVLVEISDDHSAEPKHTAMLNTRLDPADLNLIKAAAAKKGLRVSTYVRETMIRIAKRETSK